MGKKLFVIKLSSNSLCFVSSLCVWASEIFLAGSDPLSFVLQNQMGGTDLSQNDTEPPGQNKSTHISQYNNTITNRTAWDPQTLK